MTRRGELKTKVLDMLLNDSRMSFRTIANEMGVSTTTISKVVNELEESGVIVKYTTMVDWKALGFGSVLCIRIGVHNGIVPEEIGKALIGIPTVKQVLHTTDELPFAVLVVCMDSNEIDRTIETIRTIPGVGRVQHNSVLNIF